MEKGPRYRIVRRLGEGASAELFEALSEGELGFERRVVIKRMRAENVDDDAFVRAFMDEAKLGARLHHANIVAVLDFGVMDGAPFQVLELVDGLDAQALIDRQKAAGRQVPVALALHLTVQIAHALSHVHGSKGSDGHSLELVHRDVKPSNVLLSWSGDIKLADFGIARARERLSKTMGGFARGTLGYMAPEQTLGGQVDARSDLFSLGCLLFALITGASPLAEEAARQQLLRDRALSLSGELPSDVAQLLTKLLAFQPADRHASAAVLAAECGRVLAKRLSEDPRTMLVELLAELQPKLQPKANMAALFDLALLLGSDPNLRRFESVARTEATVLVPPPAPEEITDRGEDSIPEWSDTRSTPAMAALAHKPKTPTATPPPAPAQVRVAMIAPAQLKARRYAMLGAALLALASSLVTIRMLQSSRPVQPPPPAPVVGVGVEVRPRPVEANADAELEPTALPAPEHEPRKVKRRVLPTPPPVSPAAPADALRQDLDRVGQILERLAAKAPADRFEPVEDHYLELSALEARTVDPEQRRRLQREVARLAQRASALEHTF